MGSRFATRSVRRVATTLETIWNDRVVVSISFRPELGVGGHPCFTIVPIFVRLPTGISISNGRISGGEVRRFVPFWNGEDPTEALQEEG